MREMEGGSPVGPMVGRCRPRYEILDATLGPFLRRSVPEGGEAFLFFNLDSVLRQFFSQYTAERLTKEEIARYPNVLGAELVNLAAHYRHYAWTRHGVHSTVALYHSSARSPDRVAALPGYKEAHYSKRVDAPPAEYAAIRRYVDRSVQLASVFCRHVPSMYVVDTGGLDPEAWPWAMMAAGDVGGPAVVISHWEADSQYALASDLLPEMVGKPVAVLRASSDRTTLIEASGVVPFLVRKSKTPADSAEGLRPNHGLYITAMSGEADLGVEGLQKMGPMKAAKMIRGLLSAGKLPPGSPSLEALVEETGIQDPALAASWGCLVHRDYVRQYATPSLMASISQQIVDLVGLGEMEQVNAKIFSGCPVEIGMALAGEEY